MKIRMDKAITRTCYSKNEKLPELIACSAVKFFNIYDIGLEVVIPCIRHNDTFVNDILCVLDGDGWEESEQGFITNYGRFVDRKEALAIAKANNQIINDIGYEPDELYSEMLY